MKRKASIISLKENKDTLVNALKREESYLLQAIFVEEIDYDLLKDSDLVLVDNKLANNLLERIELFCLENNLELYIFANSFNSRKRKIQTIDDLCFLKLNNYQIGKLNSFIKLIFDKVFSLIFIILSFPIFVLIAILIKVFDGGPVLYLQKRKTKNERTFIIYKFRTMIVNAERESGVTLSFVDDPRLTKIGKFLRKYKLDELPQIYNVLLGEMSLVGPRPEREFYINKYKKKNKYYKYRFNVKAGITGYAQIYAKYSSSYINKLDYDLFYIANYSIFMDVKIIIKTILYAVFKKQKKLKQRKTQYEEISDKL